MIALIASTALAALAMPIRAAQEDTILDLRVKEIAALLVADPQWSSELFDPAFLKAVPPDKLEALCSSLHAQFGRIESMQLVRKTSAYAGKFDAVFEKNFVMPVTIGLSDKAPHSVYELWFGVPAPGFADLNAAAEEIGKLPGRVSFAVCELGGEKMRTIAAHDADTVLAIGSTFKLYVLGALARELDSGKRHLDDVVRLDARYRSLPSGMLQTWPVGSPLTLSSLAALMISHSDNTATDHLLFALGRSKVEEMIGAMGNQSVARNIPFLATSELFKLKFTGGGKPADEYLAREGQARREYLEREVAAIPLEKFDASTMLTPSRLDTIEWFASAHDLCRAMDWLRRATEKKDGELVRGILSINPGLDVSKDSFPYVGFKGGSEPGVLNLTYLLRAKSGAWYAVSAGWNDPVESLSGEKLMGIVTRVMSLLGKQVERAPDERTGDSPK